MKCCFTHAEGSSGQPGSSLGQPGLAEQPAQQQHQRISGGSPPWPVLPRRRPQHRAPSQCTAQSAHKLDCLRMSIWCPSRSATAYVFKCELCNKGASCAGGILALQDAKPACCKIPALLRVFMQEVRQVARCKTMLWDYLAGPSIRLPGAETQDPVAQKGLQLIIARAASAHSVRRMHVQH